MTNRRVHIAHFDEKHIIYAHAELFPISDHIAPTIQCFSKKVGFTADEHVHNLVFGAHQSPAKAKLASLKE
jgi:hypothetical protein